MRRSFSLPFTIIQVFSLQDSFRIRQVVTSDLDHSLQWEFICEQFAPAGEMRSKTAHLLEKSVTNMIGVTTRI